MQIQTKKFFLWVFLLIGIGILAFVGIEYQKNVPIIRTFEDCVRAGKPVLHSTPQRCEISDGQFIVDIRGLVTGEIGKRGTCSSYTFEKYITEDILNTRPHVDYTTYPGQKENKIFSDEIKQAIQKRVQEGVNFSGHYLVPSWSCGDTCWESVVIDGRTGKFLITGIISKYGVETRNNSRLLIMDPPRASSDITINEEEQEQSVTSYYILENDALNLVCREYTYK